MGNSQPKIRNSDYWPMIVVNVRSLSAEEVLRKALDAVSPGYTPEYEYVVIPMHDACVVSFRPPQPKYEIHVRKFDGT